jgi:hypothetical protein
MELFHHPAFQSLVLPALLAGAGVGVLRVMLGAAAGVRWAPAAAVLALVLALALLPGFAWPPRAATQKLPWIILAAWLLALVLEALRAGRWLHALAGSALWLGAGWWLQEAASTAPRRLGRRRGGHRRVDRTDDLDMAAARGVAVPARARGRLRTTTAPVAGPPARRCSPWPRSVWPRWRSVPVRCCSHSSR